MKVVITRKDFNCSFEGCCFGKLIKAGSIAVTTIYKEGNFRKTFHFHPECHTQFMLSNRDKRIEEKEEVLARRIARRSNKPQGRPRKYSDPLGARNLISLIYYHKKVRNEDEVQKLLLRLKGLEL